MQFKSTYLLAMRQQAPKMYRELLRSGEMEEFLDLMNAEAHKMYHQLTEHEPKLPNGVVASPSANRDAERAILNALIEFPPEGDSTNGEGPML